VRKCLVRLSDGRNKMAANLAAILFLPFESRTNKSSPYHLIAGPFESRTQKVSERWPFESRTVRLSDVQWGFENRTVRYSSHSNTGLFEIRIWNGIYGSKFRQISLVLGWSTSLDSFGMNKIFLTLFFIKRSRLVWFNLRWINPINHPKTGIRIRLVFGSPLYTVYYNSNTVGIRILRRSDLWMVPLRKALAFEFQTIIGLDRKNCTYYFKTWTVFGPSDYQVKLRWFLNGSKPFDYRSGNQMIGPGIQLLDHLNTRTGNIW
jgi:hypothetical protein